MEIIRLGTIGSGAIVHSVLEDVAKTEGICLEAVYSRSMDKAQVLAAKYGAPKAYDHMDAFLADDAVNTVYIATPNLLHYEQAKQALLAGKHVICEKPFVTKLEHARELLELARQKGLFLAEAMPTAYLPNFQIMKEQLANIGQIKLVQSNFSLYSGGYDQLKAGTVVNKFNHQLGGGTWMDMNFYNVYMNVALFGKPLEANYYPNMYNGITDTSGTAVLRYDGFISTCAAAKDSWGVNYFQIQGDQGYIYADGGTDISSVKVVTKSGERVFNEQSDRDRWIYEVQSLTKMLLAEDLEGAYRALEVTLDVVQTMEIARKKAGIFFPGDR